MIIVLKNLTYLLLSGCLGAQYFYEFNQLEKHNGIYRKKNENKPANGIVYAYVNGEEVKMGKVIYGKKHGRWIEWHPNERKLDENYKHGLLDGTSTLFYKNGQREWRYTFNKNILDGIYTKWYRNGKRAVEGVFENGHPSGVWVWRNKLGEITKKKKYPSKKKNVSGKYKQYFYRPPPKHITKYDSFNFYPNIKHILLK